jgi:HK97 gp10 family phage protein
VAVVTVKLEGIENVRKFFDEKRKEVIEAGERAVKKRMNIIKLAAKGKFIAGTNTAKAFKDNDPPQYQTGELMGAIKAKVDGKGKTHVVAHVGVLDADKELAIKANAVEFGHASPGKAGGFKTTPAHPFIRPAIDENKKNFVNDMKTEIQKVIEKGR